MRTDAHGECNICIRPNAFYRLTWLNYYLNVYRRVNYRRVNYRRVNYRRVNYMRVNYRRVNYRRVNWDNWW